MRYRLQEYLDFKGITAYRLEMGAGLNHSTLYDILKNRTKGMQFKNLEKICRYLNCTPNDIIDWK